MEIDKKIVLNEREILFDCLYSQQRILSVYTDAISNMNIKNTALELNNLFIDIQGQCYEIISQLHKLGHKDSGGSTENNQHMYQQGL